MEAICGSDELEIFTSTALTSMIDYKWGAYAYKAHGIGCVIHILYIISVALFINDTYLMDALPEEHYASPAFMVILGICLIYPLLYDGTQMFKQGVDYLKDTWNYVDMLHIGLGYLNLFCQSYIGSLKFTSKLLLVFVILICLMKTFFFMRIVK